MKKLIVILIFIGITFNSCKKDTELSYSAQLAKDEATIDQYLATNKITNVQIDTSGFRYVIIVQGTGKQPDISSEVALKIAGSYFDGSSIVNDTTGLYYSIAAQIRGLALGLLKMPKGSTYAFYIPSGLASGPYGSYNGNVMFTITMFDDDAEFTKEEATIDAFLKAANDSVIMDTTGVRVVITQKGTKDFPTANNTVVIKYNVHFLNSTQSLDSSPSFQFLVSDPNDIPGLEIGIKYISEGGQGSIYIPSRLAYGYAGSNAGSIPIPRNSILVFDVTLTTIE